MVRIVGTLVFVSLVVGGCNTPPPDSSATASRPAVSTSVEPAATSAPTSVATTAATSIIEPFPGVRVKRAGEASSVELDGVVCLHAGWLEQVACAPQSREHESLVVPTATPSQVHAALLMAGFEPGAPGQWSYENERYDYSPPTGEALEITVRRPDDGGGMREESIRHWIRDHNGRHDFPDDPWIFAGSRIEQEPEGEIYVADYSGSIIGLVTFGDEVVGFSQVFADQDRVQPPEWEADVDRKPAEGTPVTLILRRAR